MDERAFRQVLKNFEKGIGLNIEPLRIRDHLRLFYLGSKGCREIEDSLLKVRKMIRDCHTKGRRQFVPPKFTVNNYRLEDILSGFLYPYSYGETESVMKRLNIFDKVYDDEIVTARREASLNENRVNKIKEAILNGYLKRDKRTPKNPSKRDAVTARIVKKEIMAVLKLMEPDNKVYKVHHILTKFVNRGADYDKIQEIFLLFLCERIVNIKGECKFGDPPYFDRLAFKAEKELEWLEGKYRKRKSYKDNWPLVKGMITAIIQEHKYYANLPLEGASFENRPRLPRGRPSKTIEDRFIKRLLDLLPGGKDYLQNLKDVATLFNHWKLFTRKTKFKDPDTIPEFLDHDDPLVIKRRYESATEDLGLDNYLEWGMRQFYLGPDGEIMKDEAVQLDGI